MSMLVTAAPAFSLTSHGYVLPVYQNERGKSVPILAKIVIKEKATFLKGERYMSFLPSSILITGAAGTASLRAEASPPQRHTVGCRLT
jgi:hypothetical protein